MYATAKAKIDESFTKATRCRKADITFEKAHKIYNGSTVRLNCGDMILKFNGDEMTITATSIDQILNLEWKYLVPISMVNLILMVLIVVFDLHF